MILQRIYGKLDGLSLALFSNGWLFIVPYLLIYLCFKYLHLPASVLKIVFISFHFCLILLFTNYLLKISRKAEVSDFIFWIGLFLLFLLPGAYLEFPSDPWEHFRRIFAWQSYSFIDENPLSNKFSYFWGWTLVYMVAPLYRRTVLGVYGAFWELVLAYQFYLLALRLGFSKSWARIQVLATVCLFGVSVFSFYRYYALSSTIVAYIAYVGALIVLMDVLEGKKKQALLLPLLVLIILFNHLQEFMLLGISTAALFIDRAYEVQRYRKKLLYTLALVLIASWIVGAWVVRHPQFAPLRGFNSVPPPISSWGTYRIWDLRLPYFEAIAVHGLVSLSLAILLFNKYRRIALLTLVPLCLLLFFPFVLLLSALLGDDYYTSWRALYAFPFSFMLVAGLKEGAEFLTRRWTLRSKALVIQIALVSIVVCISLIPTYPYRGRLWFVLHKPSDKLSLERIDVAAQSLLDNYPGDLKCLLAGDGASAMVLAATLGLNAEPERLSPRDTYLLVTTKATPFVRYLQANQVCAFVVAIPSQVDPAPLSQVGQLSQHWPPSFVNQDLIPKGNIDGALESLTQAGWTRTSVPPFYWLYKSPSQKPSALPNQVP